MNNFITISVISPACNFTVTIIFISVYIFHYCPTDSDHAETEKSDKDETYSPSNHDSDASDNYSSNDDSGADSGDETHDYNTYSGDETDNVDKNSQAGSTSSSDEGTFYEYSFRMFCLSRLPVNSILWNARMEYFNGIFIMFPANIYII